MPSSDLTHTHTHTLTHTGPQTCTPRHRHTQSCARSRSGCVHTRPHRNAEMRSGPVSLRYHVWAARMVSGLHSQGPLCGLRGDLGPGVHLQKEEEARLGERSSGSHSLLSQHTHARRGTHVRVRAHTGYGSAFALLFSCCLGSNQRRQESGNRGCGSRKEPLRLG